MKCSLSGGAVRQCDLPSAGQDAALVVARYSRHSDVLQSPPDEVADPLPAAVNKLSKELLPRLESDRQLTTAALSVHCLPGGRLYALYPEHHHSLMEKMEIIICHSRKYNSKMRSNEMQ